MSLGNTFGFIVNHPLNRQTRFKSIARFLNWQVSSRMAPGAIVFEWVNGSKFLVRNGETGLTGNIYTGLHEFADMGYLLHFLRPEDLFVDIGANVGSYTILACAAVGSRGYAFEPVPATHCRLVENLRLNHIEQFVEHPNVGIGARAGKIAFTSDLDTVNHALANGEIDTNSVSVDVTTLDCILSDELPLLIKIDVEGFESPVLQGAEITLANPTLCSVIMELNRSGERYGYDETDILSLMFDNGFKSYSYNPLERSLVKLNGKNPSSSNTLFIKDREFAEERIQGAAKIVINGVSF